MRISAAVVDEVDGPFRIEELQLDEPRGREVLVRVAATGICHTDGVARHGDLPFPLPGVLGHEGAGTVVAVGPDARGVAEGDRVVIGWPSCGECEHCAIGEPRYCDLMPPMAFAGTRFGGASALRRLDGSALHGHFFGQSSFATHALTTDRAVVKVPDSLPVELLAPLACGVSTGAGAVFHTLDPRPGSSLVVYGVGTVGLSAIMAARNTPATRIIAVDRNPARLTLAEELGATHAIDAGVDDPVAAVREICGGFADYALECTGLIPVCRQAVDSVGMLGTCALVGAAPAGAELGLDHMTTLWGKRIVGVLGGSGRGGALMGAVLGLYASGRFPFDRLVTWFDFADIQAAFDAGNSGEVIKPLLRMPA